MEYLEGVKILPCGQRTVNLFQVGWLNFNLVGFVI